MSPQHLSAPHHPVRSWAVASVLACSSVWAHAISLGTASVSSGIGQPLRAAIAITQFKVEDLRQLQVRLAESASFQNAGMPRHPALQGLEVRLEFRGNGEPVLALWGQVPVTEHFLDLIVEAQWPSGRLAMNYTLLVSPAGATTSTPDSSKATPSPSGAALMPPVVDPQSLTPTPALATAQAESSPAGAVPLAAVLSPEKPSLTVQPGDTAAKLALRQLPEGVTLEQMLVAMVRGNPEAFIEGNVNLLRAGAQIQWPSALEARQIPLAEARQAVITQNADFAKFARRLAQSALKAQGTANREMAGKISPASPPAPEATPGQDKLTLSANAKVSANVSANASAITPHSDEARLAIEREIQEKSAQLTALKKNLDDLAALSAQTNGKNTAHSASNSAQSVAADSSQAPSAVGLAPNTAALDPTQSTTSMSLLAQLSQHPSLWLWMAALLASMFGLAVGVRRRQAKRVDFFSKHSVLSPANEAPPTLGTPDASPSGLPPQFAHLDLNLTPNQVAAKPTAEKGNRP